MIDQMVALLGPKAPEVKITTADCLASDLERYRLAFAAGRRSLYEELVLIQRRQREEGRRVL